jgi:dolichyl-phosphate-mannose--protein O-mannosyl transferase
MVYHNLFTKFIQFRPFVEFPVVALRRFSAMLGASLIPMSYITIRSLGHSRSAATLAAALLVFGKWNAFIKINVSKKERKKNAFLKQIQI